MADSNNNAKNILFIMTDQLRYDSIGCNGHPLVKTPNIDRIAAMGVNFSRCYTPSAVCVPARASLSTGRYVQSHRVYWNEAPWPKDEKLMGEYLGEIGVDAFQCGKSHYNGDAYSGEHPGPENFMFDGRLFTGPFPDMKTIEYNDGWYYNRDYREYLRNKGYPEQFYDYPHQLLCADGNIKPWGYYRDGNSLPCALNACDTDTAFTSRRALDFLEKPRGRPWMLFLSYYRPHQPYCPSPPYYGLYPPETVPEPVRDPRELDQMHEISRHQVKDCLELMRDDGYVRSMRSAYYGLIAELDDWIGRVLDALELNGLLDRTLIIFSSDHGDYLGDHYMFGKESFYDQAYHVPLIIADPSAESNITRGKKSDAFVSLIDILPTMLDWHGARISSDIDGGSLLSLLRGKSRKIRDEAYMLFEYGNYYTHDDISACTAAYGVRDEEFCYWYIPGLDDVLFSLRENPLETYNCASNPKRRETINEYRNKLLAHLTRYSDRRRINWRYNNLYKK